MTARPLIVPGAMPSRDANGRPLAAKLRFYQAGTTTYQAVYTDSTLINQISQPILSDAAGRWPAMWADDSKTFDVAWSDQAYDELIKSFTNLTPAADAAYASQSAADASATSAAASASAAATSASNAAASATAAANATQPLTTGNFGGISLSNIAQITVLNAPTAAMQVATKTYVDNTAFQMAAGSFPAQGGNAGKFITTDGTNISWAQPTTSQISDYASDQTSKQAATLASAKAFAIAFAAAL